MTQAPEDQKHRNNNQMDIFDPEVAMRLKVLVVGCGGIGSTATYFLAQMGFADITIIDYDDVENHNIASQFYKESDIGSLKVEALKRNILEFTGVEVKAINGKFAPALALWMDIVIVAVDNMAARKEIIEGSKARLATIDGRMSAEALIIYTFTEGEKIIYFANNWFSDDKAEQVKCTEKSISYNCGCVGALIARQCKDVAQGKKAKYEIVFDMANLMLI